MRPSPNLTGRSLSRQLWLACAAGFVVRLIIVLFLDVPTVPNIEYSAIAHNLISGHGYALAWSDGTISNILPSAFMPPLETLIHFVGYSLLGYGISGAKAILILHCFFGAAFIFLIGSLTQRVFNDHRTTLIAAWLAAVYPPFIYASLNFGITAGGLLLEVALLYYALKCFSEGKIKNFILFGLVGGLFSLLRGEGLLYVGALMIFLFWINRNVAAKAFKQISLSIIIIAGILSPWVIRNYITLSELVVTSTSSGLNLWRGNNTYSNGSAWTEGGGPLWSSDELWNEARKHLSDGPSFELTYSRLYRDSAVQWISDHPGKAFTNDLAKAGILWTVDLRSKDGSNPLYIVCYGLFICGGAIGIINLRKNKAFQNEPLKAFGSIVFIWCIVATLVAMVFFPLPRFQVLLCGVLTPFAGYGIAELTKKFRK
ncbi:MAG TPA: glycosyltransferase family 39 protein [Candidatus Kapabacteria bacterium]|nr:glycosyltransferase family 39 protein [Candidatus Kapabacteria bacterium]